MPTEVSFGEEVGDDALSQYRLTMGGGALGLDDLLNQGMRHDEIAETKAGEEGLAEAAGVDDTVGEIEDGDEPVLERVRRNLAEFF